MCPRNLAALSEHQDGQGSLLLFIDDALQPGSEEDRAQCRRLQEELESRRWDGLRDHLHDNLDDGLWAKMSTDRASCLNRSCSHFRHCPFFLARREIESADVVVANHALVMAALESESVLPPPKDLLLVLDEGHHLPDVARDALEMEGEITALFVQGQIDMIVRHIEQCQAQYQPKNPPRLLGSGRLQAHTAELRQLLTDFDRAAAGLLAGEEQHRFILGQLPEALGELAQRLYKLCDGLRGLSEFMMNDLQEKTGTHDALRVQRALLQMSRAFSYLEALSKLWRWRHWIRPPMHRSPNG